MTFRTAIETYFPPVKYSRSARPQALSSTAEPTTWRRAVIAPLGQHGWRKAFAEVEGTRARKLGRGEWPPSSLRLLTRPTWGLATLAGIPGEVRSHLNRPLDQIMVELKSSDTGLKGLALETLAVRLLYELGLIPVAFRERGSENDGAEVDLIAEGADTHFHRWMVQCKNVAKVHVAALAKEVGTWPVIYRAQVILLVTTGDFTATVSQNARQLAETSGHQAILVDKTGLAIYLKEGVTGLFRQFEQRAREILEWKAPQRGVQAAD